jgi:hypothetical protein
MIDEYSVITNGILTSDDSIYKIIDPLGYFVIKVEVFPEPETPVIIQGGGGYIPEEEPKKRKIIRLTVHSSELGIDYVREIEPIDVTHTVRDIRFVDGNIIVEIFNPSMNEVYTKTITLDVKLN